MRGFSCASSFRLCFDHTMKAFMGRLICSGERDMIVIIRLGPADVDEGISLLKIEASQSGRRMTSRSEDRGSPDHVFTAESSA